MKFLTRLSIICTILIYILLVTCLAAAANPVDNPSETGNTGRLISLYPDVPAGYANAVFINYLANRGIVKGFPDGTFRPAASLTRAEAAAFLVRTANLKSSGKQAPFSDVSADHWAAESIEAAASAGLLGGYTDGTFRPDTVLTRAEGLALFLRLSKQPAPGVALPALSDMGPEHWAAHPVAVGLDAGMIGLSADGKQFLPDAPMTRGDLARVLGMLLTKEPDLARSDLKGTIKVLKGIVTLTKADGQTVQIKEEAAVQTGEVINTSAGSEVEITFPDGSGLYLSENSELGFKEARGRSYITRTGKPGTSLDWLAIDLKQGNLFGALATRYDMDGVNQGTATGVAGNLTVADLNFRIDKKMFDFLAAATDAKAQNLPWYQQAQAKKVRVQVDMPWSVCAIRGTFWNNTVEKDGRSRTTLLEGSGEVRAAGKTVTLAPGQRTEVTDPSAPPKPPAPMTSEEKKQWVERANWIVERAQIIHNNMEQQAPPPPPAAQQGQQPVQPVQPQQPPVEQPVIVSRVVEALVEANNGQPIDSLPPEVPQPAAPKPSIGGGGGGGGGGTSPYITGLNDINETVKMGDSYTFPAEVTAMMSDGSTKRVPVTWESTKVDTNYPSIYPFHGSVSGYSGKVKLTLRVEAPLGKDKDIEISPAQPKLAFEKGITLDLGSLSITPGAKVTVTDASKTVKLGDGHEIVGRVPVVDIEFKNLDINAPVELSFALEDTAGVNLGKIAVFHFNEITGKWEYVYSEIEDGVIKAWVSDFSIYAVLQDEQKPTTPVLGWVLLDTGNSVKLTFTSSDDSGIKRYKIYRNGIFLADTDQNTYTDSGLQPGEYRYTVQAFDYLENESYFSELKITIFDDGTTVYPEITSLSPAAGNAGILVTLTGGGFGAERGEVMVGGRTVAAAKIVSWNQSEIKFHVPDLGSYGAMDLWIKTAAGLNSNIANFKYEGSLPGLPAAYYGTITVNGGSVAASPGTVVEARVDGKAVSSITTVVDNMYGNTMKLTVQGMVEGVEIEFWIKLPGQEFIKAAETCNFVHGDFKELNLNISL